jgi:hypothetical protein
MEERRRRKVLSQAMEDWLGALHRGHGCWVEEKEWRGVREFTYTVIWKRCFWSASALSEKGGDPRIYTKKLRFSLFGAIESRAASHLSTHTFLHYLNIFLYNKSQRGLLHLKIISRLLLP